MSNIKYHLSHPGSPRQFWIFAVLPNGKVLVEHRYGVIYRWEMEAAEARLRWAELTRQGWVKW